MYTNIDFGCSDVSLGRCFLVKTKSKFGSGQNLSKFSVIKISHSEAKLGIFKIFFRYWNSNQNYAQFYTFLNEILQLTLL